ncbi:MAG: M1 family metallopeptidase [Pyrinomonadaceae bacterium]|nr:M1 family metallopeptidase [Pyrinomonadaceae bacterium]
MRNTLSFIAVLVLSVLLVPVGMAQPEGFTKQDVLRGSVTPEREWWDLQRYKLAVEFMPDTKQIRGSNTISFKALKTGSRMQIDLQEPLKISKVLHGSNELSFTRNGNVYLISFPDEIKAGTEEQIKVIYGGTPVESKNPPWSGGITWDRDDLGEHFIQTTCQGIGASIWWPTKDHGYDEPDRGMQINVTVPERLVAVANGRLKNSTHDRAAKTKTYFWEVNNPINNYAVNVNIGNYVSFSEKYEGKGGALDLQYWVLPHQKELAMKQFKEAPRTIEAFEHWFGPYPFYEDSFKLVTVSYAGMEHQSSVTYGNWFRNGYRGRDLSGMGVGYLFDFIIVHETGHEWFGNNVSVKDVADLWVHEGFTNYSENLFVEYHFSKKQAEDYVIGTRKLIQNKSPIIGTYGVNKSGSGDMYYKGGNMLHTIRHAINDDKKWLGILRGLNKDFGLDTVTTRQVESYMSKKAGIDLSKVFDQYLRDTRIPKLWIEIRGNQVYYRYENVIPGFSMPIRVKVNGKTFTLKPGERLRALAVNKQIKNVEVDRNFYVTSEVKRASP